jgi:hypothetical protein
MATSRYWSSAAAPRSTGRTTPLDTSSPSQSWAPMMMSGPSPSGAACRLVADGVERHLEDHDVHALGLGERLGDRGEHRGAGVVGPDHEVGVAAGGRHVLPPHQSPPERHRLAKRSGAPPFTLRKHSGRCKKFAAILPFLAADAYSPRHADPAAGRLGPRRGQRGHRQPGDERQGRCPGVDTRPRPACARGARLRPQRRCARDRTWA